MPLFSERERDKQTETDRDRKKSRAYRIFLLYMTGIYDIGSNFGQAAVAETWRRVWRGTDKFFADQDFWMTVFSEKISIFKISKDLFFHFFSQIFRIFTMLNVAYDPFPHKRNHWKTIISEKNSPTSNFRGDRTPVLPGLRPCQVEIVTRCVLDSHPIATQLRALWPLNYRQEDGMTRERTASAHCPTAIISRR